MRTQSILCVCRTMLYFTIDTKVDKRKYTSGKGRKYHNMLGYVAEAKINGNPEASSSGNASPGHVFVMGVNA